MRINNTTTNPLDPFAAAEALKARVAKLSDAKANKAEAPAGAGQTQALIQQALSAPDFRPQAVEDARRLLESGELDTDPAIQRLAKRLTDFGI